MKLFPTNKGQHIGQSPGTVTFSGTPKVDKVRLSVTDYDLKSLDAKLLDSVEDAFPYRDKPTVSWINVDGLHDDQILNALSSHYGVHPLILEDICNVQHRPKLEEQDGLLFVTLKMLTCQEDQSRMHAEQVSFVLGKQYLLSFQERSGDVFEPVRKRIEGGKRRIHNSGSDYLMYALIDTVVDHYYVVLETLGERLEALEDALIAETSEELLRDIQNTKKDLSLFRQSVWPLRQVISDLIDEEWELIRPETQPFWRDVYDHVLQVMDAVDALKEMSNGLIDLYRSTLDQKSNDIMKLLTLVATIFIPLTFVAGIYGMNFDPEASPWNMPELSWPFGYPLVWGVMIVVGLMMVWYFKRKKWL